MLQRLRRPEPFGKAGLIIGVLALVLAMVGGAWAASGGLNGKQKKEVKQIVKSLGQAGPQGPQGSTGAQGPTGPQGAKGEKGEPGSNGKDGSFSTEPLPSQQTLSGIWDVAAAEESPEGIAYAQISFPMLATSPLTTVVQFEPGANYGVLAKEGSATYYPEGAAGAAEAEEAWEAACPGSAAEPQAEPGFLCVYQASKSGSGSFLYLPSTQFELAHEFGVLVPFRLGGTAEELFIKGSWAVTAE